MPNENYILLERTELNASASSVTFANIPQTGYTDLKIVVSAMNTVGLAVTTLKFNGSSSGYTYKALRGSGSAAASFDQGTWGAGTYFQTGYNINGTTPNNNEIYIPNYTGSTNKSVSIDGVQEANSSTAYSFLVAGLWSNTAAITSITVAPDTDSFAANSTFSLYGIAALGTTPVIAPKASGGNIIDYDGTYWIHTFLTSGTFTPQTGLTCDYLVVAGGGGGGGYAYSGGGGAGGYLTSTGFSVGSTITVTVGAGGAGGANANNSTSRGTVGNNSVLGAITATGGGGGGSTATGITGGNGGSGGGGGGGTGTSGGSASPSGQGNNGGVGATDFATYANGGGGGGAGAVGGNAGSGNAGAGGAGSASSITGTSVTRAGGGGGTGTAASATGGAGGGGAGNKTNTAANPGTVNTGGGGGAQDSTGGVGWNGVGGAGGSGIVIIRYPAA